MVRLMVGEHRLTVHERRCEGWPEARAVVPCDGRAVTHFIPYYVTRVFHDTSCTNYLRRSHALRTFAPHICHAPSHSRASRASARLHTLHTTHTLFFAYHHFFVAIVSRCSMFAHVSTTSNTLNHVTRSNEHTRTHCIRTPCTHARIRGLRTHHSITLDVSLLRLLQR